MHPKISNNEKCLTGVHGLDSVTVTHLIIVVTPYISRLFLSKTENTKLLRYYDGQLVRTIDDPLQVSRGAGFFILSQGEIKKSTLSIRILKFKIIKIIIK